MFSLAAEISFSRDYDSGENINLPSVITIILVVYISISIIKYIRDEWL